MGQILNCFGDNTAKRDAKIGKALLLFQEMKQHHKTRMEELQREIRNNTEKINDVTTEYKQGRCNVDDAKRTIADLLSRNAFIKSNMNTVNQHLMNTQQQEEHVKNFASSLINSQKMNTVVEELGGMGFKIENLDKMTDKVDNMMNRIREVTATHNDLAADSNAIEIKDIELDSQQQAEEHIARIDEIQTLNMMKGMANVSTRNHGAGTGNDSMFSPIRLQLREISKRGSSKICLLDSHSNALSEMNEDKEDEELVEMDPYADTS